MNHSEKFWRQVAQAMPDYKKWDRWLTKHGSEYHF
jgi:predicted metal-dependent hydrolase